MGKIANALDRRAREKILETEPLPPEIPEEPEKRVSPKDFPGLAEYSGFSPKLVVLSAPNSVDAENFKVLRAQLLFPKNGARPKSIMVTSTFPGEGKTFVAANLAASVALGVNEHVLLVDCDLRNPSLHRMLGYSNLQGLHEYLTGKKPLSDLLIRTKIDKLSLLTSGTPATNPSELLSSAAMKAFLQEVTGRYEDRFIIIDATPSQVTAEANVLANYVDAVLFVVMANKVPRDSVRRSIENLGSKKVVGIVFNGYSHSYKGYRKYYKKYYR